MHDALGTVGAAAAASRQLRQQSEIRPLLITRMKLLPASAVFDAENDQVKTAGWPPGFCGSS